jgi:hypothetical protein
LTVRGEDTLLQRLWEGWCRFWFDWQPPHALALFRVLLGVFLLFYWGLRAPHIGFLFTPDGIYVPLFDAPAGGLMGARSLAEVVGALTAPAPTWVTWALYSTLMGSLVLFLLGWWTRLAAVSHFLLYVYFYHVELYSLNASFDRLFMQVSLVMCFCRCDEVISLRAWQRRRRGLPIQPLVPFWPARLIALKMVFLYFGTGFTKVFSDAWQGGEILYYSFLSYWGTELSFWFARTFPSMALYDVAVYATIVFELSAPVCLHIKRLQPWYFLAGFMFHLTIAVSLQIWQFMAIPATYLFFLDPASVERLWGALVERVGFARARSDARA